MSPEHEIPLHVRVRLAHACVQALADETGADVLHLKGPALADGLRAPAATSRDADVLVRPADLPALLAALESTGWRELTGFDTGSAFRHAANYHHPDYGVVDIHRLWPGFTVSAETAFAILWERRGTADLAGRACAVPERAAQMVVLATHAARNGRGESSLADLRTGWHDAAPEDRARARALAASLGAEVALTVGLGGKPSGPDADLWRYFSAGGDRLDEWRARWRSASGAAARRDVVKRLLVPDRQWYALVLGHEPTPGELLRIQAGRLSRGVGQLVSRQVRGPRGRR